MSKWQVLSKNNAVLFSTQIALFSGSLLPQRLILNVTNNFQVLQQIKKEFSSNLKDDRHYLNVLSIMIMIPATPINVSMITGRSKTS